MAKHSYHSTTYQLTQSTFYLRDPSGRLLSVYQKAPGLPAQESERYLYGMDMIGVMQMDISGQPPELEQPCEECPLPPPPLSIGLGCNGQRMYYLKDQVGNVRVILLRGTTAGTPPLAFQNYYPFGMKQPGGLTGSFTQRFGYQGEYAEQDPETKLAAFEARMYDAVTGRWLAVDPQHQFHSPYLAMGNNPVMMVDPDGEYAHIVIGALVGGALNLIFNAGSVDNFGEALALFGAGAANGGMTAAFGPLGALAGGMITGSVNNIVAQTNNRTGLSGVNWDQVKMSGFVGGASSIAGYGAGSLASKTLGAPIINNWKVTSPFLKGLINGAVSGGAGGYAGGFVAGFITTGDIKQANSIGLKGMVSGSVMGGGMGAASAYVSARKEGVNYWTGKFKRNITGDAVNFRSKWQKHGPRSGKSYFDDVSDAQAVLDAYRNGQGQVLDAIPSQNRVLFRYNAIKGYNVNSNLPDGVQFTSTFMIKGAGRNVTVVPTNPTLIPLPPKIRWW